MGGLFLAVLVVLTSVLASLIGKGRCGLHTHALPEAVGTMLDCVGVVVAFYLVNVVCGMFIILVLRSLTQTFLSLYVAADPTLLGLSLVQGLAFYFWVRQVRTTDSPERS